MKVTPASWPEIRIHGGRVRDSTCFGYEGRAPREVCDRCVRRYSKQRTQRNSVVVKSVKEGGTYWRVDQDYQLISYIATDIIDLQDGWNPRSLRGP